MRPGRELVAALAGPDAEPARAELQRRYRPLLLAYGRRVGVAEGALDGAVARALDDLAAPTAPDGMRERLYEAACRHVADASLSASDLLQTAAAQRAAWDHEWRAALVRFGLAELARSGEHEERALRAFELHGIEKRPAGEVAEDLGMSRSAVLGARSRLLASMQVVLERLERDF